MKNMSSEVSSFTFSLDRDLQVRIFGWALLFFWIAAMVYIARDFFFPKLYGIESFANANQKDESYGKFFETSKKDFCIFVLQISYYLTPKKLEILFNKV